MPQSQSESLPMTLPFEKFWGWLHAHCNCIVRAGTPEVVLFDHEDYHWHLAQEPDEHLFLVQLVRGKDLVGEMVVLSHEISFVQCTPTDAEEWAFECVIEHDGVRDIAYHFVLTHGYEDERPSRTRWTH